MTQPLSVRDIYRSYAQRFTDPAMKLGWESQEAQRRNFDAVMWSLLDAGMTPLVGATLHDAGCGMGHLLDYLKQEQLHGPNYIGTDSSEEFLAEARARHPGADFRKLNLLSSPAPKADITVCIGMLAFHHPRSIRQLLNTLWKATERALVFNCWWYMDGYWSEHDPDEIQRQVSDFIEEKVSCDFAFCAHREGADYGVPTERMYTLTR